MALTNWQFFAPTRIVSGPGSVQTLGDETRALGATRVLVVTDRGVATAGVLPKVLDSLGGAGLEAFVFDRVEPNPTDVTAEESHRLFAEHGCDLAIGVGGGSSMDTAKATGILARNPGPVSRYDGANRYTNPPAPTIAVPTTAGTGAEASQTCVIHDPVRQYKAAVRGLTNVSSVAILDPQLLTSLPPAVIAASGMDALSHAIESYLSTWAFPLSEALSLEAIRVIGHRLRAFFERPSVERCAADMQYAAMVAGMAFANARVTAVHAMAHAVGGRFNVSHGILCAVMLPIVMRFSLGAAQTKLARIAAEMGEEVAGLPEEEAASRAVEAVERLARDVGIPPRLRETGVTTEPIEVMARDAESSGIHLSTPRKPTLEDLKMLLASAI